MINTGKDSVILIMMKQCSKCKESKELDLFYKRSKNSKYYSSQCKSCCSLYQVENREKISDYMNHYRKERRKTDINFKLTCILRTRLCMAIRTDQKSGSAVKDLGCSVTFLKKYIESLFSNGMTWENYGEWHIDHKIPLSSLDLSNPFEFKKACHYTNLQPLWAIDNIRKADNMPAINLNESTSLEERV